MLSFYYDHYQPALQCNLTSVLLVALPLFTWYLQHHSCWHIAGGITTKDELLANRSQLISVDHEQLQHTM